MTIDEHRYNAEQAIYNIYKLAESVGVEEDPRPALALLERICTRYNEKQKELARRDNEL